MIDYGRSYAAHWHVYRVNEQTWADAEELAGIVAGSISVTKDCTGDAPLLESGGMSVLGDFERGYYRIVMVAEQNDVSERNEIATLLFEGGKASVDYAVRSRAVDGRSVLYPAFTQRIVGIRYAPAKADGAQYAARLLRECCRAPVTVEGGFTLGEPVVHKLGSRVLEAVWQVLTYGGYTMQILGDGTVAIRPYPTAPTMSLDEANARLLMPGVTHALDFDSVPNRYTAISDFETVQVVNDSPDSEVSTVARGYILDEIDESPCPVDGETLSRYAQRMLRERSTVYDVREYEREWGDALPNDIVHGSTSTIGLDDNLRIQSQTITCDMGATVKERAAKEVELWN